MKYPEAKKHGERLLGKKRFGQVLADAKKAQAKGTLGDFLKQLVEQIGPMLGPIIAALIKSLLGV